MLATLQRAWNIDIKNCWLSFYRKNIVVKLSMCLDLKCFHLMVTLFLVCQIPGYTRKDGTVWLYSNKAVSLVQNYMQEFSELFEHLAKHTGNDVFYEYDVFSTTNDTGWVVCFVPFLYIFTYTMKWTHSWETVHPCISMFNQWNYWFDWSTTYEVCYTQSCHASQILVAVT